MPTPPVRRKILVLLLGAALVFSWSATAAPRHVVPSRTVAVSPAPPSLLGHFWTFLTSVWGEEGCNIDPDGRCVKSPSAGLTSPVDTGCHLDPNGCRAVRAAGPASPTEEGCHIDPNGLCFR